VVIAHILGLMAQSIKVSGKITKKLAKARILGLMEVNILVSGKMTQEMVKAHLPNPMA
jgi:hypothetical protein